MHYMTADFAQPAGSPLQTPGETAGHRRLADDVQSWMFITTRLHNCLTSSSPNEQSAAVGTRRRSPARALPRAQ